MGFSMFVLRARSWRDGQRGVRRCTTSGPSPSPISLRMSRTTFVDGPARPIRPGGRGRTSSVGWDAPAGSARGPADEHPRSVAVVRSQQGEMIYLQYAGMHNMDMVYSLNRPIFVSFFVRVRAFHLFPHLRETIHPPSPPSPVVIDRAF